MSVGSGAAQPSPAFESGRSPVASGNGRMRSAWCALGAYILITLAATWPLARGLTRDVAWDLGDSLLVMWALAWDGEQMLGILRGDLARFATFYDANIFYKTPLVLAYSEHFIPQALQALPIYAATRNPILAYNVLFLSTFILSALGAFLLVRELTGSARAAFVAGLLFAFAPYRLPQSSHLHVLSSQWMPFALYGFHRYLSAFARGEHRRRPLAGAALALVAQNLSTGYYLLYFSPFAALYVVWEAVRRGIWSTRRLWVEMSVAALVVVAVTLPPLLPYRTVARDLELDRSRTELMRYSADVHSYATGAAETLLWAGRIRAFPKPEGDLFFGIVPLVLALVGVLAGSRLKPDATSAGPRPPGGAPGRLLAKLSEYRWLPRVLAALVAIHVVAAFVGLIYRRFVIDFGIFELRISNVNQMVVRAAIAAALLYIVSPRVRAWCSAFAERGFFLAALVAAMWLSLGPVPLTQGRPVEIAAPYALLFQFVPGFDGVRVPARFGMIAILMLAVLAGYGAAAIAGRRRAAPVLVVLSFLFLAEGLVWPFPINSVGVTPGYTAPEARVYRPGRAPAIYREVTRLPPGAVLAELPLGESDFDVRAMYYSTVHWRPLLNGYSGFYPRHYGALARAVTDVPRFPDVALGALRAQGATHVIVHEGVYDDDRGVRTSAALRRRGAIELFRDGSDVLFQLP